MLRGLVLVGVAAVSWGTTGSVTTLLVAHASGDPLLIGAARMWVAAIGLVIGAGLLGAARGPLTPALGPSIAMGACTAAYQAAYFSAVTMTGIAITALIAICSAPVIIAVLATLALGERLTLRIGLALALGVGGTALLIAAPATAPPPRFLLGAALALAAGAAYALYAVIAKSTVGGGSPPLMMTAMTFTVAAVLTLPVLFITRAPLTQLARGWPWLLYLGAVATAAAYALYTIGLRHVPASIAGVVTLLEPLTATLLGVFLFGERLGPTGGLGALLLVVAIALLLPRREIGTVGASPA